MGAWGIQIFENDHALDWMGDFMDQPSEQMLLDTFEGGWNRPPSFWDRFFKPRYPRTKNVTGEHVLAAAEVIATLSGKPPEPLPEDLENLPPLVISRETVERAIRAIDGMLLDSNLKSCWAAETDDYEEWLRTALDAQTRLVAVVHESTSPLV